MTTPHENSDSRLMPPEKLGSFVQYYMDRRQAYLELAERQGSPLYVFEPDALVRQARTFTQAFAATLPDPGFFFAVKSNNCPEVAKTLVSCGFGLDVSSGVELAMALETRAAAIVFSGPGKTGDELTLAVANSPRVTVLLDSFGELQKLEKTAASAGKTVSAGVRLTTTPNGLWRKFGILPERLAEFWTAASACSHVKLAGIQFHTSWNLTPDAHTSFIQRLGEVLTPLPEAFKKQLAFIDIGGGFWPEQGEWLHHPDGAPTDPKTAFTSVRPHYRLPARPITDFADAIGEAARRHIFPVVSPRICMEPGRWVCHLAMQLLMRVTDKKAGDLVVTDAGTNAVGWERFETDYFPVLNLSRPDTRERPCHILGALCTPHDVWGYSYFGEDIAEGDILLIPAQGAYTYSLRQNFIKPLPRLAVL
ncbi:MAG: diaminopimelate decarboxylase family protein [Thermodesulfobacteriota bacterium]